MKENDKVLIEDSFDFERKAMDDLKTVKIEDNFKTEGICFKVIWYIFLGLVILGVLGVLSTNPFPENIYMIIVIIPATLVLYFIFRKIAEQGKQERGFLISKEQIEIQIPSKPSMVIPWKGLKYIRVVKMGDDEGPTYKLTFKDKLELHTVFLHNRDFHRKKMRLFLQKLRELASYREINFSAARRYFGFLTKDHEEEVNFNDGRRF